MESLSICRKAGFSSIKKEVREKDEKENEKMAGLRSSGNHGHRHGSDGLCERL